MVHAILNFWRNVSEKGRDILRTPAILAFLPAMTLGAFWLGGEPALIVAAAGLPVALALLGPRWPGRRGPADIDTDGTLSQRRFDHLAADILEDTRLNGSLSATFVVQIDSFDDLSDRYGPAGADHIIAKTAERLCGAVRSVDLVSRLGTDRFVICMGAVKHLDLETCIQMAARLHKTIEDPIALDGLTVYVSGAIGFCQSNRKAASSATEWVSAASLALRDAQQRGPGAIRAFSEDMQQRAQVRIEMRDTVLQALERGEIQPWFQPQISTDTGRVTGFEALARWQNPARGLIPPAEFLPALEQAGLLERLAEVMMYHAFTALKAWDAVGLHVPQIGVNFAGSELGNPQLIEKVKWELDRFDLSPERLAVEILETVVADAGDDVITRNINQLSKLGCQIDLDDFGTGHASIASIKRFSVNRIKIDRSFVMKADRDPEQQRMIGAILTMSERLGLDTLAEGVETVGEHALLAQLGCGHVQGYGIAKPMPFDATIGWMNDLNNKVQSPPRIIGSTSR